MDHKTMRPRISPGCRVGMLTVEAQTQERHSGYMVWKCRCDCGGEILLDTRCLQRQTVTDCGCATKVTPGATDLTGQRFGRLVCLEPTDTRRNGRLVWKCRCDCGKECLAVSAQLRSGYKKSCGCLSHPPIKDLIGTRFGQLVVTGYEGKQHGMPRWRCICDCGTETVAGQSMLQSGKTKSCGCLVRKSMADNLKLCDGTSVSILEATKKRCIRSNTSGYTGVYWHAKTDRWNAQITFKGKTYYLGSFLNIEDAVKARKRGEEMHEDFLEQYYREHGETK